MAIYTFKNTSKNEEYDCKFIIDKNNLNFETIDIIKQEIFSNSDWTDNHSIIANTCDKSFPTIKLYYSSILTINCEIEETSDSRSFFENFDKLAI